MAVDRGRGGVAAVAAARRTLAAMAPVQVASLAIGLWWVANGIGALLLDPDFATGPARGSGVLFGAQVTVNGWHAVFHLLPGLIGIVAARRPRAALAYLVGAGVLYIATGAWGLIAGGSSVGPIAVDQAGDVVHLIEGAIASSAAIVTVEAERPRRVAAAADRAESSDIDREIAQRAEGLAT